MNTLILSGGSGIIDPPEGMGVVVRDIDLNGASAVTLSGSADGVKLIASGDMSVNLVFKQGETVYAFGTAGDGVVNYLYNGDASCAMQDRAPWNTRSIPWRFRT